MPPQEALSFQEIAEQEASVMVENLLQQLPRVQTQFSAEIYADIFQGLELILNKGFEQFSAENSIWLNAHASEKYPEFDLLGIAVYQLIEHWLPRQNPALNAKLLSCFPKKTLRIWEKKFRRTSRNNQHHQLFCRVSGIAGDLIPALEAFFQANAQVQSDQVQSLNLELQPPIIYPQAIPVIIPTIAPIPTTIVERWTQGIRRLIKGSLDEDQGALNLAKQYL